MSTFSLPAFKVAMPYFRGFTYLAINGASSWPAYCFVPKQTAKIVFGKVAVVEPFEVRETVPIYFWLEAGVDG